MTKPKDNQPLYHMVKEGLISIIRERGLKPGDLLPTESELEEMFHVSRTTIRTAINELQHEGYIVKQQGRGTFVASNSYAECTALLQSFYEDATQRGNKVTTMLISAELIIPEETVQEMLEIPREEVLKIQRVRYLFSSVPPICRAAPTKNSPGERSIFRLHPCIKSWRRPVWIWIMGKRFGRYVRRTPTRRRFCRFLSAPHYSRTAVLSATKREKRWNTPKPTPEGTATARWYS